MVCGLTSKVFLMSYECVNDDTSKGVRMWKRDSYLRMRLLGMSLSPTFSIDEKVDQYIRNKTHKPDTLRFWVEGGVITLCNLT